MPLSYKVGYVPIAGCNNPHVHLDLAGIANTSDTVVLKRAKEFHLKIGRQLSNLVQEKSPFVGGFKEAFLIFMSPVKEPRL